MSTGNIIILGGWIFVLLVWFIMWTGADNNDARATGELVPILFGAIWLLPTIAWLFYNASIRWFR